LGRTRYVYLAKFGDIPTTSKATTQLSAAGIKNKVESDNLTVNVDTKKYMDAIVVITADDFVADTGFDITQLLDNSMSTTNYDKNLKSNLYLRSQIENALKSKVGIVNASVVFAPDVDNSYSFLSEQTETIATVSITTNDDFKKSMAEGIAVLVASAMGNPTTNSITVIDQNNRVLFNGSGDSAEEYQNQRLEYEAAVRNLAYDYVKGLGKANGWDSTEVGLSIAMDWSTTQTKLDEWFAYAGTENGPIDLEEHITSESTGGQGGVPGTDSNDETDYYIQTGNTGESSYTSDRVDYKPSNRITETIKNVGDIIPEQSKMTVVLNKVHTYSESDLRTLGLLEGTTYEEYQLNNDQPKRATFIDNDGNDITDATISEYALAFANCAGIPAENVVVQAWQTNVFIPTETTPFNWDLILRIVLAALIIGMLIFVVFRGMAPAEVIETEPELSVEKLLATTKENQGLEDIEFSEGSETRRLIEKLVDEHPDAVANLLRSWLEDSWEA
jgi:flagellar M-ring protein FliF